VHRRPWPLRRIDRKAQIVINSSLEGDWDILDEGSKIGTVSFSVIGDASIELEALEIHDCSLSSFQCEPTCDINLCELEFKCDFRTCKQDRSGILHVCVQEGEDTYVSFCSEEEEAIPSCEGLTLVLTGEVKSFLDKIGLGEFALKLRRYASCVEDLQSESGVTDSDLRGVGMDDVQIATFRAAGE